jgi:hypothetical protein
LAKVYVEVEVEPGVAFHRVAAQHTQLRRQPKQQVTMPNTALMASGAGHALQPCTVTVCRVLGFVFADRFAWHR